MFYTRRISIIAIFLGLVLTSYAQQAPIDKYIADALESNIALQKQELSYEASLATLEEAKAYFFPTLSVQARFSVARGGRNIVFPVGDLMNPVYQNLNLINATAQAASPDYPTIEEYPTIENVNEPFLRPTDQETVIRLQMPIFNQAIIQNHRIQQNLSASERIGVDIYKRELIKEVKEAYFNYAQASEGVQILENALSLVEENLRTTESLHRNHKVTYDVVYGAQAEVKEVERQLAEAERNQQTAEAFFNFLLNRDYQAAIDLPEEVTYSASVIALEEARQLAFQQREEIQQLNYYLAARDQQIKLNKGNRLPQLNLQADYGIQGTDYSLDDPNADFFLGTVALSWNLFDRSINAKVQRAQVEQLQMQRQKEEVQQQIGLQVVQDYYALEAALKQIAAAKAEIEAAQGAYRLVKKQFEQGQANLVTHTNARTQLTTAQQNYSIAIYRYQALLAGFERSTASYIF
jgi:outer membrane protein